MASFFNLLMIIIFSFKNFASTKAQGPNYLFIYCVLQNFTANSTYQTNLRTLYSSLSSKAKNSIEFYNTTIRHAHSDDTAYGMFMCRGDTPSAQCGECVQNATLTLLSNGCKSSIEGLVWYDQCMVRYSNTYFFSKLSMEPFKEYVSPTKQIYQGTFNRTLFETLNKTAEEAAKAPTGKKKFATEEADLPEFQKLYCLAQCTPDLSPEDCRSCLNVSINGNVPRCCGGREGGRVMYPNCMIRFELYTFYGSPSSPAPAPTEDKRSRSRTIILIVVPIVVVILFTCFCYLLRRRARKSLKTILRENFGHESTTLEGLQFDLNVLKVATNNFSLENLIGKGGFGEVYKVWRQWQDGTPFNTLDPNLKESYHVVEVMKCIQIGLLCVQENINDRPSMVTVVSYLNNLSLELPSPHEPAFFTLGRFMDPKITNESSSSQSAKSLFSVNEMSISKFHPR
ncbi:hypothetical protein HN51_046682 [Arachis hypogaea]